MHPSEGYESRTLTGKQRPHDFRNVVFQKLDGSGEDGCVGTCGDA